VAPRLVKARRVLERATGGARVHGRYVARADDDDNDDAAPPGRARVEIERPLDGRTGARGGWPGRSIHR
jgi:hypothetical protein